MPVHHYGAVRRAQRNQLAAKSSVDWLCFCSVTVANYLPTTCEALSLWTYPRRWLRYPVDYPAGPASPRYELLCGNWGFFSGLVGRQSGGKQTSFCRCCKISGAFASSTAFWQRESVSARKNQVVRKIRRGYILIVWPTSLSISTVGMCVCCLADIGIMQYYHRPPSATFI